MRVFVPRAIVMAVIVVVAMSVRMVVAMVVTGGHREGSEARKVGADIVANRGRFTPKAGLRFRFEPARDARELFRVGR